MDIPEDRFIRATRGEPVAIDDLLVDLLPSVRAFVRLRMGPELRAKESASDLVQSACREVLARVAEFRHQGRDEFRRWLFTTALRKVKNKVAYYRADKRDAGREAHPGYGSDDRSVADIYQSVVTPSDAMVAREQMERIEAAFDRLSADHREVITLAKISELPHKEIAVAMGRSEVACRRLLYRALAQLSNALDGRAADSGE